MTTLSDSRFYMWRAIFALAHADGHVSDEERRFMEIYLSRLSATPEQKQILKGDIEHRHDVAPLFAKISVEKDVEDFFNFARLLVWSDGDFGKQERQIMDLLRQRHDTPLGTERLLVKLQNSGKRKSDWLKNMRRSVGEFKDIFDLFSGDDEAHSSSVRKGDGVSSGRFHMWRAVFAMAHADEVVTAEERKYLQGILSSEPFSEEQKKILEKDMDTPQDVAEMFLKVDDQNDRSQFFYHARMLVWSDGDFGEQEQKIIMRLKQNHVRTVDFDQVIKDLDLALDDEQKVRMVQDRDRVIDQSEGFFRKLMRQISGR